MVVSLKGANISLVRWLHWKISCGLFKVMVRMKKNTFKLEFWRLGNPIFRLMCKTFCKYPPKKISFMSIFLNFFWVQNFVKSFSTLLSFGSFPDFEASRAVDELGLAEAKDRQRWRVPGSRARRHHRHDGQVFGVYQPVYLRSIQTKKWKTWK